MSNQLQENLNLILEEKNTKLLPENLKVGITCLGVTGELKEGVDTSDATANPYDMAQGTSAYVNGEKVEGALPVYEAGDTVNSDTVQYLAPEVKVRVSEDCILRENSAVVIDELTLANSARIDSSMIMSGNQVLGVSGSATEDATATAEDISNGLVAYANGKRLIGAAFTIDENSGAIATPETVVDVPAKSQVHLTETFSTVNTMFEKGSYMRLEANYADIASAISLKPSQIAEGNTVLGIEGAAVVGEGINTSDATATADDIVQGKTAYVNGKKIEGTVKEAQDIEDLEASLISVDSYDDKIRIETTFSDTRVHRAGSTLEVSAYSYEIADAAGLYSDVLINTGERVLGVEGSIEDRRYGDVELQSSNIEDMGTELNITTRLAPIGDYSGVAISEETQLRCSVNCDELASAVGVTADKIVAGNTILGVEGIVSANGIDTSDATATAGDIVVGKTAYANGEKIEGSVTELVRGGTRTYEIDAGTLVNNSDSLTYNMNAPYTAFLRWDAPMKTTISYSDIAAAIGLTGDMIVKGHTVLGVEGKAVISTVELDGFLGNLNNLQTAMDQALQTAKGDEAIRGNNRANAQLYNFIARGGYNVLSEDTEGDSRWLIQSDAVALPCTPIQRDYAETSQLGTPLPITTVTTMYGEDELPSYFVTPKGKVFCYPGFTQGGRTYVTSTIVVTDENGNEIDMTQSIPATTKITLDNGEVIYINNEQVERSPYELTRAFSSRMPTIATDPSIWYNGMAEEGADATVGYAFTNYYNNR